MGTVTVRQLDDRTKASLRIRAARNGHSMEQEVREILRAALAEPEPGGRLPGEDWVDSLRRQFEAVGFTDDLAIPPRTEMAEPISLDE